MVYEENVDETELLKTGVTLRKLGKNEEALKKFDEVLELNPRSAAAYRERAILLHEMGKKELLHAMGKKEQAKQDYKKAAEIDASYKTKDVTPDEDKKGEADRTTTGQKVRDVMKKNMVAVPFGATVLDVLDLMHSKKVSGVLVSDGTEIVGIVTEKDLIKNYRYISGKDIAKVSIKNFISYPMITISADTSLEDAAGQMAMRDIRHILVSEGDEPVGLVSFKDIFCVLYY